MKKLSFIILALAIIMLICFTSCKKSTVTETTGAAITTVPTSQATVTQATVTQAPSSQSPSTSSPVTGTVVTKAPTTQPPGTDAPVTQAPLPRDEPVDLSNDINSYGFEDHHATLDYHWSYVFYYGGSHFGDLAKTLDTSKYTWTVNINGTDYTVNRFSTEPVEITDAANEAFIRLDLGDFIADTSFGKPEYKINITVKNSEKTLFTISDTIAKNDLDEATEKLFSEKIMIREYYFENLSTKNINVWSAEREGVNQLFDGNLYETKMGGGVTDPVTVYFKTKVATKLSGYALVTGGDTSSYPDRNPIGWKLYGKSGDNWVIISEIVDGGMDAVDLFPYGYMIENPAEYTEYKIEFTPDGGSMQLNELCLFVDEALPVLPEMTIKSLSDIVSLTSTYYLTQDIVAPADFSPIGTNAAPFTGKLIGNGYKITGLTCPLFGAVSNAEIKDVTIEGNIKCDVAEYGIKGGEQTPGKFAIALCACTATDSEIRNVTVKGSVETNEHEGDEALGGIVASSTRCELYNCINYATVKTGNKTKNSQIGGIVGSMCKGGVINGCLNYGEIYGTVINISDGQVAGIAGYVHCGGNTLTIAGNINFGSIHKGKYCAGIVGYSNNNLVTIENNINLGTIDPSAGSEGNSGQIAGLLKNKDTVIKNNFGLGSMIIANKNADPFTLENTQAYQTLSDLWAALEANDGTKGKYAVDNGKFYFIDDLPVYTPSLTVQAGSSGNDTPFIVENTAGANSDHRYCDGRGVLVYKFDGKNIASIDFNVRQNYALAYSTDGLTYTEFLKFDPATFPSGSYTGDGVLTSGGNDIKYTFVLSDYSIAGDFYIKLYHSVGDFGWGATITSFTINYKDSSSEAKAIKTRQNLITNECAYDGLKLSVNINTDVSPYNNYNNTTGLASTSLYAVYVNGKAIPAYGYGTQDWYKIWVNIPSVYFEQGENTVTVVLTAPEGVNTESGKSGYYFTRTVKYYTPSNVDPSVVTTDNTKLPLSDSAIENFGVWGDSPVEKLFDGDTKDTKLGGNIIDTSKPAVITFKAEKPVAITGYLVYTGNDSGRYTGRNPSNWILYGSADKTTWTVLDRVDNGGLLDLDATAFGYTIDTPALYEYYKLEIWAAGTTVQLNEIEFYAPESALPSASVSASFSSPVLVPENIPFPALTYTATSNVTSQFNWYVDGVLDESSHTKDFTFTPSEARIYTVKAAAVLDESEVASAEITTSTAKYGLLSVVTPESLRDGHVSIDNATGSFTSYKNNDWGLGDNQDVELTGFLTGDFTMSFDVKAIDSQGGWKVCMIMFNDTEIGDTYGSRRDGQAWFALRYRHGDSGKTQVLMSRWGTADTVEKEFDDFADTLLTADKVTHWTITRRISDGKSIYSFKIEFEGTTIFEKTDFELDNTRPVIPSINLENVGALISNFTFEGSFIPRDALRNLVFKADKLGKDEYTEESWAALEKALADAVNYAYKTVDYSKQEFDAVYSALDNAINALEKSDSAKTLIITKDTDIATSVLCKHTLKVALTEGQSAVWYLNETEVLTGDQYTLTPAYGDAVKVIIDGTTTYTVTFKAPGFKTLPDYAIQALRYDIDENSNIDVIEAFANNWDHAGVFKKVVTESILLDGDFDVILNVRYKGRLNQDVFGIFFTANNYTDVIGTGSAILHCLDNYVKWDFHFDETVRHNFVINPGDIVTFRVTRVGTLYTIYATNGESTVETTWTLDTVDTANISLQFENLMATVTDFYCVY